MCDHAVATRNVACVVAAMALLRNVIADFSAKEVSRLSSRCHALLMRALQQHPDSVAVVADAVSVLTALTRGAVSANCVEECTESAAESGQSCRACGWGVFWRWVPWTWACRDCLVCVCVCVCVCQVCLTSFARP